MKVPLVMVNNNNDISQSKLLCVFIQIVNNWALIFLNKLKGKYNVLHTGRVVKIKKLSE